MKGHRQQKGQDLRLTPPARPKIRPERAAIQHTVFRGGRNRHDLRGAPRAADRKLTSTETAVSEQQTLLLFSEADCTDIPAVTGVVQPGMDTLVSKVTAQSVTLVGSRLHESAKTEGPSSRCAVSLAGGQAVGAAR